MKFRCVPFFAATVVAATALTWPVPAYGGEATAGTLADFTSVQLLELAADNFTVQWPHQMGVADLTDDISFSSLAQDLQRPGRVAAGADGAVWTSQTRGSRSLRAAAEDLNGPIIETASFEEHPFPLYQTLGISMGLGAIFLFFAGIALNSLTNAKELEEQKRRARHRLQYRR